MCESHVHADFGDIGFPAVSQGPAKHRCKALADLARINLRAENKRLTLIQNASLPMSEVNRLRLDEVLRDYFGQMFLTAIAIWVPVFVLAFAIDWASGFPKPWANPIAAIVTLWIPISIGISIYWWYSRKRDGIRGRRNPPKSNSEKSQYHLSKT
jgi:hypothetical protein